MKRWLHSLAALAMAWTVATSCHAEKDELLNMGFYLPGIRDVPLADVRITLQIWAEEIGKLYGFEARAVTYDDMRALYRDTIEQRISIAIAPAMELAEYFSPDDLAEGFSGERIGGEGLTLIVRKDLDIRQFSDLRKRRVLRLSNDRLTEVFLEVQCRRQTDKSCQESFSLGEEKRDIQSIHKVFFGQADAALVRSSALQTAIEMNPQIKERTRVLLDWKAGTSLAYGMMSSRTDKQRRAKLIHAAEEADKTIRGKQILELFKTDHMGRVDKSSLNPYWQLIREYAALTAIPTTKKKP